LAKPLDKQHSQLALIKHKASVKLRLTPIDKALKELISLWLTGRWISKLLFSKSFAPFKKYQLFGNKNVSTVKNSIVMDF
jgi:hypothetical protein